MFRRARKWLVVGVVALALADVFLEPSPQTFICLGVAAVFLLLIAIVRLAPKYRILAVKVPLGPVVVVLSLCVYAAIAEAVLRIFFFERFPVISGKSYLGYRYDAKLGWFPVANSTIVWSTGYTEFNVVHNSQGFRGPAYVQNGRPAVIFLGDSFVWGYGVATADRFSEKFQANHPQWNVYNFGVTGFGTDQEYLLLQRYFDQYQPRLVFLVICVENDRTDNSTNLREEYFKPYFLTNTAGLKLQGVPVPRTEWSFCSDHSTLAKSYLVRLSVRAWLRVINPKPVQNDDPSFLLLSELRRFVESKGCRFAVGLTDRDAAWEQFLSEAKIAHVDLSSANRFGPHDHWTAQGHTIVCKKIDEFLTAEKLLER